MSKRIIFTFDPKSYSRLEDVKDKTGSSSLAEAVRSSVDITRSLQEQAEQGYDEIIVRNPRTGKERILHIPGSLLGKK